MTKRMIIAGGSGFVGSDLKQRAKAAGYEVTILGRSAGPGVERWDPVAASHQDTAAIAHIANVFEGADAIVNLAGASIGHGRLDAAHKAKVIGSRVEATRATAYAIAATKQKPRVWLNASATGYYGDTGEDRCDEQHPPGNIFLCEVCTTWEREATQGHAAIEKNAPRLVIARIGIVFDKGSEAWSKMAVPIRYGVAGPLGSGKQWMAWISLPDLGDGLMHLIANDAAKGPFNLVAPEAIRQIDLVKQAARALKRPAFLPAPAFGLKLLLGSELAKNLILSSCYAVPRGLEALGYRFQHPRFSDLLPSLL
ncbi:MAG: TIGR01777 family protein [Deltaproteobacteria bacterium]|nr:TIGR01777 family protein [Deltaproteobacteria bacterium]